MVTKHIYCSRCRDAFGERIARGKTAQTVFRRVAVTARNPNGSYQCQCECGHCWTSKSQEAALLFAQPLGG